MASKKREGIDAIKSTAGGKRRDDRQVIGKTYFDPITIDAKNALTVIYLLKSPEENVMLRAVASLEVFGRKDPENFKLLCSLGIFEYVYPLIEHTDNIVKRFTLKLIGMLCGLEEFRDQMLEMDNVLETFADILKKEADLVLQEFSALILAELSKDYIAASELLKVDGFIEVLFDKLSSPDPDIEKNCLDIMGNLLKDVNGIEAFVASPGFDVRLLVTLTFSSYPTIQLLVIEILKQLTAMCRNPIALVAFRDAKGIETTLGVLEREDWTDLHDGALDLLLNVVDCAELCDYLQTSGCLSHLIGLLDITTNIIHLRKILGILARMSQTTTGGTVKCYEALILAEMDERFVDYLLLDEEDDRFVQMESCLGIANLAKFPKAAKRIMNRNPVRRLTELIVNTELEMSLRNMAAYALNILSKVDKRVSEALLFSESYKDLYSVLNKSSQLPVEICQNVIQVFIGISQYDDFRGEIISEALISALLSCLPSKSNKTDPSLQVDALECLSEYMLENEARAIFSSLNGVDVLMLCLSSRFASIREWAGHLTLVASQNVEFIKLFIQKNGLNWMLQEKNTMYSMPSWRSAVEAIFANFLPAKFAYTGRLDFQDVTQDVFYIYSNPRNKFMVLEELLQSKVSPIVPVYIANFNTTVIPVDSKESSTATTSEVTDADAQARPKENLPNVPDYGIWTGTLWESISSGYMDRTRNEDGNLFIDLDKCLPDPYLKEYLENLKKKLAKDDLLIGDSGWNNIHPDLMRRRVKIIAELVANEMAGPACDLTCNSVYKEAHLREIKYYFGTNIIPLGGIRMGSYLERAMLFKVLADRVELPCALVRGLFGRAWIEVSVPVLNVEDLVDDGLTQNFSYLCSFPNRRETQTSVPTQVSNSYYSESFESSHISSTDGCAWFPKIKIAGFKSFPAQFLKANAIVDLITEPGRILEIDGIEADDYRGAFLKPKSKDCAKIT